ncbi:Ldh family oxidoreductase [Rubinisphaera margarita]|uniref:Ldh family oxidoreductase n=1 Tax=Rubinisphaera margarita TaxID=2909586 RepID=UPI001EE7B478|nr:Ldh family oxidoreductase [Rubinisphaera margarita]MCG6157223.1 Ldh family oxidoreductase [Rubinisphaera margarita]
MTSSDMAKVLASIFIRKGMYAVEAETVAQRMIEADRIGRAEFGCVSVLSSVQSIDVGDIDPRALAMKKSETPGTILFDANEGMGHVAASKGTQAAIDKARTVGLGAAAISNSQSLGTPLVYACMAARAGMIGCCLTSTPAPKRDPDAPLEGLRFGRQPAAFAFPDGGTLAGYEFSFGEDRPLQHQLPGELSYTVGMLHAMLTSGLTGSKVPSAKTRGPLHERFEHFILVIDPAAFAGEAAMKKTVDALSEHVDAFKGEHATRAAIKEQAFELSADTLEQLQALAEKLKVEWPA